MIGRTQGHHEIPERIGSGGMGELYREPAIEYYRRFTDLRENADPELQPRVEAARGRIQELLQVG